MATEHDRGRIDRLTQALAGHLIDAGIEGRGRIRSANEVSRVALAHADGDGDAAVAHIIRVHTALAAGEGFLTGLGGFVTLPIAIPANVIGFYVIATRMAAAVASARGHELAEPEVRSAVLLCLTGEDASEVLGKVGLATPSGRITARVLRGLPPAALMAVNKAVAFRIVASVGKTTLARLGRGVPLAGGVIGATMDAVFIRRIAAVARTQFPEGVDAP